VSASILGPDEAECGWPELMLSSVEYVIDEDVIFCVAGKECLGTAAKTQREQPSIDTWKGKGARPSRTVSTSYTKSMPV
jgi:hypothetical protein